MDDDVPYYQILDNFTIWKLETISNARPLHHPPSRTFSLPSSSLLVPQESQNSLHLPFDVPLHKKRNLIKNLRSMIEEMQQKVERIEVEVSEQDVVGNFMPTKSKHSQNESKNDAVQNRSSLCLNPVECQHFKDLLLLKKQNELLNKRLHLDKQTEQSSTNKNGGLNNSGQEKRFTTLETENKLLNEKLKLSLERLSILNKEKCQQGFSTAFNRYPVATVCKTSSIPREFQEKLRKSMDAAVEMKDNLIEIYEDFQELHHWAIFHIQQGQLQMEKLMNQRRFAHSKTTNGKIRATSKEPLIKKIQCNDEMESRSLTSSEKEYASNDRDSEVGSDCMNVVERIINDSVVLDAPRSHNRDDHRGSCVLCRIQSNNEDSVVSTSTSQTGCTVQVSHKNRTKTFELDFVVEPSPSQNQIFEIVKPTVLACTEGINANIFMYGESGSGKTYTIEGCQGHEGLLMKCVDEILKLINLNNNNGNLFYSVVELRNETFRDVLNACTKSNHLDTKQNPDGSICLVNLTRIPVNSLEDYKQVFQKTQPLRKSPTSHFIYTFFVSFETHETKRASTSAKLNIIDLAGSGKVEKSSMDPIRAKEFQSVVKSLTCLGDVICAINTKQTHVPHRSSKLTHFLQDSLQSHCRTDVIIHMLPDKIHSTETISTLMFGQRIKGTDANQAGTRTPTKPHSKLESSCSTPRPRRPSAVFANISSPMELKNSIRRNSVGSDKGLPKKGNPNIQKFSLTQEVNIDQKTPPSSKQKVPSKK